MALSLNVVLRKYQGTHTNELLYYYHINGIMGNKSNCYCATILHELL